MTPLDWIFVGIGVLAALIWGERSKRLRDQRRQDRSERRSRKIAELWWSCAAELERFERNRYQCGGVDLSGSMFTRRDGASIPGPPRIPRLMAVAI